MVQKEAAAQAGTEFLSAKDSIVVYLDAIDTRLKSMQDRGINPRLDATAAEVKKVIDFAEAINKAAGKAVIPIHGADYRSKYQSLNTWLGRSADAPLEPTVTDVIRDKMEGVLNAHAIDVAVNSQASLFSSLTPAPPAADSLAAALRGQDRQRQLAAARADSAKVPAPQPAPAPAPIERPAPAPAEAATVSATQTQLVKDLEYIVKFVPAAPAPARGRQPEDVKAKARNLLDGLNADINAGRETPPARLAACRTFVEGKMEAAVAAAIKTARAAAVGEGLDAAEADELTDAVNGISNSLAGNASATATDIRQRLLQKVWLLGSQPAQDMLILLKDAGEALARGDEATAVAKKDQAERFFASEQAIARRMLSDFVVAPLDETSAAVGNSAMPTDATLKRYGFLTRAEKTGYTNGREGVVKLLQGHVKNARELLAKGDVSYAAAANIYEAARADEAAASLLVALSGVRTNTPLFRTAFSTATRTLVDPSFNPYTIYTKQQREALLRQYLGVTDLGPVPKSRITEAEKEISAAFMASKPFRYADVLQKVYSSVLNSVSEPDAATAVAIGKVAPLMADMAVGDHIYSEAGYLKMREQHAEMEKGYEVARRFVQKAVDDAKASGMLASDPLIKATEAYLDATKTRPPKERMAAMSYTLYELGEGLLAIRTAELVTSTPELQKEANPSGVVLGRIPLKDARELFLKYFGNPKGDVPLVHANVPRRIANNSILLSTSSAVQRFDEPGLQGVVSEYENVVQQDPSKSDTAYGAAAAEAQRNLAFMLGVRADFGQSRVEKAIRDAGLYGVLASLDVRTGRTAKANNVEGTTFPIMESEFTRVGLLATPVDENTYFGRAKQPHFLFGHMQWGSVYQELYSHTLQARNDRMPLRLRTLNDAPKGATPDATSYYNRQFQATADLLIGSKQESALSGERQRTDALRERVAGICTANGIDPLKPILPQLTEKMLRAPADLSSPDAVMKERNGIMLVLLDIRSAELEHRLGSLTVLADGKPIRISELQNSKDPKGEIVAEAAWALQRAKELRGIYAQSIARQVKGFDQSAAIQMVENAIGSLEDGNLTGIARPPVEQIAIKIVGDIKASPTTNGFQASIEHTMVQLPPPQGGAPILYKDYASKYGGRRITADGMFLDRSPWTPTGTVDGLLLRNPFYSRGQPLETEYLAVLKQGVVLTGDLTVKEGDKETTYKKGQKIDAYVRAKFIGVGDGHHNPWMPVWASDKVGEVAPENVMLRAKPGTTEPVVDNLWTGWERAAQQRQAPRFYKRETADDASFRFTGETSRSRTSEDETPTVMVRLRVVGPAMDSTAVQALLAKKR